MLRPTLITLLLCLAGSVWSEEGAFETEGGNIRGPRINEQKSSSDCKQEKNWPICSDEDWGPKCPSGCRIQGLTDKTDKDFGKRIDNIKKKLKDGEVNYKTVDVITKETYEYVKDNFIQAQESDGKYNQVSEDLRKKIEILKLKVSSQIERIKLLQTNIRDQVVEIKRLEVDIDIKIRACKGSCAKYVSYQVDKDSYDNIQKQLLQAESTNMRPETNTISVLKMRPIKDSAVDTIYKSLPQKGQEAQYPVFTDINQYAFVLERKGQEVSKCPSGCRVQGLITKMGKESMSRINTAKQSCLASNVWYIKHLSDSKQVYGIIKEKMLKCQDSLWKFAKTGEEIHRRLLSLKLKVKEQAEKIESLLGNLKHQLAIMKTLEVDIDIKIRSCKGSCRSVHLYMINMDDYTSWKTDLAAINTSQMIQSKDLPFLNISMVQSNMTSLSTSLPIIEGMQLDLFEDIKQEVLKLEDQVYYYNSTNNMQYVSAGP